MRLISKVAVTGVLVCALFPVVAAGAQDCSADAYCSADTPDSGGSDAGGASAGTDLPTGDSPSGGEAGTPADEAGSDTEVLGDDLEAPADEAGTGGAAAGGASGAEVLGAELEAPGAVGPLGATAPSGALPFTGSDVIGLAAIGAAAAFVGAVLVRRSRAAKLPA